MTAESPTPTEAALDESRWSTVETRSADGAGLFVYAVRTTGIFCRPACPSRRPLRKNVEFFDTGEAASVAGYRACRRCRPMDVRPASETTRAVVQLCRRLEDDTEQRSIDELANQLGWSSRHLSRLFKDTTGVTVAAYRRAQRGRRARSALQAGSAVTDAAFDAGYGSLRAFYEDEGARLGMSPDAFRRGAPAMTVTYGFAQTDLGVVLVAATDKGLCAVRMGDDEESLVDELAAEFPEATIDRDEDAVGEALVLAVELAAGRPAAAAELPLDVSGSAFQVSVWQAIRDIEPGKTATYAELARSIGRPNSHRAVANACGANPVALVVPCHRVVRSDGSSGGYRWGPDRKEALLAAESEGGA